MPRHGWDALLLFANSLWIIPFLSEAQSRLGEWLKLGKRGETGGTATESSGARVMHDGVVSSDSQADIAYVPRTAAEMYSHSKT